MSSLLTYIYTDESDETEIILTDYSKLLLIKVYIVDVDTSEILYDIEIDENLLDVAQEIDHQKQEAIRYAGRKGKRKYLLRECSKS